MIVQDSNSVTEENFLEFWLCINAVYPPQKEQVFIKVIQDIFNINLQKEYVSDEKIVALEKLISLKISQRAHGANNDGKYLRKSLKYFDLNNNETLELNEFTKALERFGCTFTKYQINELFNKYSKNTSNIDID